jgi:hypothetical protein
LVEVALVGENELFWAKMGIDKSPKLFTVLLIPFQSRARDLKRLSIEQAGKKAMAP